jgi:hypothetical protein
MSDASGRPRVVEPDLAPEEKETIIRFGKTDDRATIFSEQRGVVGRLLRHSSAEPDSITLTDGSTVGDTEALDGSDTVIAYRGTVPIGSLKVRRSARGTDAPARIISEDRER